MKLFLIFPMKTSYIYYLSFLLFLLLFFFHLLLFFVFLLVLFLDLVASSKEQEKTMSYPTSCSSFSALTPIGICLLSAGLDCWSVLSSSQYLGARTNPLFFSHDQAACPVHDDLRCNPIAIIGFLTVINLNWCNRVYSIFNGFWCSGFSSMIN